MIGFTKDSIVVNGTDPYTFYHWTQWSTTNVPATGNTLVAWVTYLGADSQAAVNTTSNINLGATATFTSATAANVVTSRNAGVTDLGALGNVTAANVRAPNSVSSAANLATWTTASWTPASNTTQARLTTSTYKNFVSDPVLKVGQKVNYVAGWRWFATNTATTAVNQGQSATQTWTIVDNAVALTVSGVAAIVALSF